MNWTDEAMSINQIKPVLELIPEVMELVKQAHVQEPFMTDTRESTMLSALTMEYCKLPGVDAPTIGLEKVAEVDRAVELYGLEEDVKPFIEMIHDRYPAGGLTKEAAAELTIAEQILETSFSGFADIEKTASRCQELYDSWGDDLQSEQVLKHAGVGVLNKEAAVFNLMGRYQRTQNEDFVKIAEIVRNTDETKLTREEVCLIGNAVTGLDKEAGLLGFDFFAECLMTKEAAASVLKVNLGGGKSVPVERIIAVAPDLKKAIGSDVAKELTGDPETVKAVAESLPVDLKMIISRHV